MYSARIFFQRWDSYFGKKLNLISSHCLDKEVDYNQLLVDKYLVAVYSF